MELSICFQVVYIIYIYVIKITLKRDMENSNSHIQTMDGTYSFIERNEHPSRFVVVPRDDFPDRLIVKIHRNVASGTAIICRVREDGSNDVLPNGFTFTSHDGKTTDTPVLGVLTMNWIDGGVIRYDNEPIVEFYNQKQLSYSGANFRNGPKLIIHKSFPEVNHEDDDDIEKRKHSILESQGDLRT
jgi:hypothetical protein